MSARRIRAIAGKDLRDTWRDGRVAALLLFPLFGGWLSARLNAETPAAVTGADAATAVGPFFAALFAIVIVVVFVALTVVPIQTAEELETGTFSALRLAASGPEILAAKALAGYLYATVATALTVATTGLDVSNALQFAAAAAALIITLVGFGLLLGLLVPSAGALNAYAGLLVLPVLAAAGAAFAGDSGIIRMVLDALPFTQAVRLLADAASSRPVLDTGAVSWLVIAAWAVAGHVLLARIAARREL